MNRSGKTQCFSVNTLMVGQGGINPQQYFYAGGFEPVLLKFHH